MATNFPTSLDALTNPIGSQTLSSPSHASQHGNANDAIEALQAKVGVTSSAVTTTLDYKVRVWNPIGEISLWATNTAPTGWLVCDGSVVNRTTYAALFAVLGTTYGAGDGSTTFGIPNLKGRVPVGRDSAQTEFDVLAEVGGAKTHTLTVAELANHNHTQNQHNHTQDSHNHTQDTHAHSTPNHNHLLFGATTDSDGSHAHGFSDGAGGSSVARATGSSSTGSSIEVADTTNYAGTHTHTITAFTSDASPTTNNNTATNQPNTATNQPNTATNNASGSDTAHNNLQPYIVLNYIIRH